LVFLLAVVVLKEAVIVLQLSIQENAKEYIWDQFFTAEVSALLLWLNMRAEWLNHSRVTRLYNIARLRASESSTVLGLATSLACY